MFYIECHEHLGPLQSDIPIYKVDMGYNCIPLVIKEQTNYMLQKFEMTTLTLIKNKKF